MLSANVNAQTILNASSKEVSWLFEIDSDAGILYWSTKNYIYNGNNFINKIIPASFSGVQLNSSIPNNNIMFPASGSFQFIDEEDTYQVSCENFLDKKFQLRLVLKYSTYEECICSWLFSIEKARYNKGIVTIEYKDFFSRYLKGTYPNTPRISSLSPSDEAIPNDNLCLPIFFGTAYIPIRCLYITDKRYYILGPNYGTFLGPAIPTYDIEEIRSPIDWSSKSIWNNPNFLLEKKYLGAEPTPVIVATPLMVDSDSDGYADSLGLFFKDSKFLDAQMKLTRSDTASLTNFSDVIKYLLKDFGIPYYYIDQAEIKGQIISWDYCVLNLLSDWFKIEADSSFSFEGDHYELVSSSVSSNNYFGKTLSGISIIEDNWYSVSVDVKETAGTGAYFNVCMNEGTGAIEHIAPINYEIPYGGLYAATTEWQTYDLLFKATSSVTAGSIGIQINDPGKTLQIRNIILNKINFVDDCQTDNTADWTRIGSNGTLTYEMEDIGGGLFDTHYLFSTSTTVSLPNYSLANGFAKTNLTFLKGKYYKISCYVKDGTATGVSIKLRISPWGVLPFSSDAVVTNGTWQKLEYYYFVFTDNYESGSVGFYSRISLGGGNIKIKDFRFHEVSSFEYFSNKFDELSLSFNGGFFAIEDRIKILSSVLIQCGSILRITDKIELWQLDNRLKTIYDYQIRSKGEGQESTFNYRQNEKDFYDYGYVAFPEADSPQMILKQKGIFIDQDKIAEPISSLTVLKDVIEIPHVSDSENAQKAGIVYLQRKNGVEETITLDCRDDLVVTQPDDMVLFNDLEYGIRPVGVGSYSSYNLTVQQVHIKPDLTISLQLLKFIHPILNWDQLTTSTVTIETDDTPASVIYKSITAGPDDDTGQNKVQTRFWLGNNILLDGENGVIVVGGMSLNGSTGDITGFKGDTFTINSDLADVTSKLIFGRTTGGNAEISYAGGSLFINRPLDIFATNPGVSLITSYGYAGYLYSSRTSATKTDAYVGFLDADANWAYYHRTDTGHVWKVNNADAMYLNASNQLGINTVSFIGAEKLRVNGDIYGDGNISGLSFTDRTPFYEGDALAEIMKIKSKNGEIDHSTLPEQTRKSIIKNIYSDIELIELSESESFEEVEEDKIIVQEVINDKTKKVEKIKSILEIQEYQDGFIIENGKVKPNIKRKEIYNTEKVIKKQLKKDVYFDSISGKFYIKQDKSEIKKINDKVYQTVLINTEIEEHRDIGMSVSMLTVGEQQLFTEIQEIKKDIQELNKNAAKTKPDSL